MKRLAVVTAFLALGCSGARPGSGRPDAGTPDVVGSGDARADHDAGADATDGPIPYVLCDGTARLRLRASYEGGGPEVSGSYFRIENGYFFLMVDGTCTFWLGGSWVDESLSRDRPVLTGTLSAAEAATLESGVPLGGLARVNDCGEGGFADAGDRIIRAEGSSVRCGRTGTRFEAAWTTITDVVTAIRTRARPLDGAMRIAAVASSPLPGTGSAPPYEWPLAVTVDSFFVDQGPGDSTGQSYLVTDTANAAALRILRDRYLADRAATPGIYANWDGLRVLGTGGQHAQIYLRDALPYEDARGLVTF